MGYSTGNTIVGDVRKKQIAKSIDSLKSHPNYKEPQPFKGEGLVAYTLRCAANLVSPPQMDGESYDVECTEIKSAILLLESEIEKKWFDYNHGRVVWSNGTHEAYNN